MRTDLVQRAVDRSRSRHQRVSLPALLMAYFGAGFGVLAIYVSGRVRKRQPKRLLNGRRRGSASFLKAMVKRK